jgi:hypothetical protein
MQDVTLVLVDTESYALARVALLQSMSKFKFAKVLVFTDQSKFFPEAQCVIIPKIQSIGQYSNLMLSVVTDFIETEFFIVSQFDGFILNGGCFREEFFNYDYIGAPWNSEPEHLSVGNGGFSWRSKKLADAVKKEAAGQFVEDAEDVFICKTKRSILERVYGCRFASREMAAQFSFEFPAVSHPTFGFHGVFHLPALYQQNLDFLTSNLPQRMSKDGPAKILFDLTMQGVSTRVTKH